VKGNLYKQKIWCPSFMTVTEMLPDSLCLWRKKVNICIIQYW